MKFETKIEKENNLRYHHVSGRLSFQDLRDKLQSIYEDEKIDKSLNVLWDISDADLSDFTSDQVEQIANYVANNWGKIPGTKAAIVVAADYSYGMVRMYEILLDSRTTNAIKVFRDINSARDWIHEK